MSLNRLKETLRPCSSFSSSFSNFSSQPSSYSQPSILDEDLRDSTYPQRKPPKSSLSQQLQRLHDHHSLPPPTPPPKQEVRGEPEVEGEEDDDEEEDDDLPIYRHDRKREPISSHFQFDPTGPFEPLVLSSEGETPIVQVPAAINCRLLEHQREGVRFLYGLYRDNHGGILGDDMGLGKTIQTIAFLDAVVGKDAELGDSKMFKKDLVGNKVPVLIICPSSIIQNWENEFSKWAKFNVAAYHGSSRDLILEKLEGGGVDILITSFDTFRIHGTILSEVQWHIVIVDEAHRLKNNKSKLYTACSEIKTKKRFGLTGTVMQNKIMELFNLFDWVAPESLGTREHFRDFYDEPLKHGQRSGAPERFVQIADERKQHLAKVLRKYLLRRTKEETIGHLMMGKEDNVVFCAMSELQRRAYKRMLQLPDIQCLINKDRPCSCGSPLKQVQCCNRTVPNGIIWSYLHRENPEGCDSCPFCLVLPCLVKLQQLCNHLELIKPNPRDDEEKQMKDAEFASTVFGTDIDLVGGNTQSESFMGLSDVEHCGKMRALERLMLSWVSQGDKILLFSYSVRMLDILEKFLIRKGYCFSRLDGSTPTSSRQSLVDAFNSSPSKQVFLISTRAGGLGLNLVSANRVVIFDPNWNPAQDLQAQDRSFRYGQKRHVVVFRLLAAGSLEELVYSRQIYKQQLSNIAVSGKLEKRYFEGVQDCKEFQGELFGISNLFCDLSDRLFTSEIIELNEKHAQGHCNDTDTDTEGDKVGTHVPPSEEETAVSGSESRKCDDVDIAVTNNPMLEHLGIVYAHRNEDVVNYGPGLQGKKDLSVSTSDSMKQQSIPTSGKEHTEENTDLIENYAHHNEDVVNYGPGLQGNKDLSVSTSDSMKQQSIPTSGKEHTEENTDLIENYAHRNEDVVNYGPGLQGNKDLSVSTSDSMKQQSIPTSGKEHTEENTDLIEKEVSSSKRRKKNQYCRLSQFMGMEEVEFSKWVLSASYSERAKVLRNYKKQKKKMQNG